jgi:predicted HD phosphohydrolase
MDNGRVTLTIKDIEGLLASAADRPVEIADRPVGVSSEMPFSHLDHALQTAAVLRAQFPDDIELAMAGLVHDIGHLLPGVGDAAHADEGARAVRAALGKRVAGLVGLHVEAKRYLVARQTDYAGELAADSVASLALQGGPMGAGEQQRFEKLPYAQDALVLRRADESGKVEGVEIPGLAEWVDLLDTHWAAAPD